MLELGRCGGMVVMFGYAASVGKMRAVGSEGGGDAAAYFHQNVRPGHVVFRLHFQELHCPG